MKIIDAISWIIWLALHPSYWLQNYKYDKKWDEEINSLMDSGEFKIIDGYCAEINGVLIWTENQPYATMRYMHKLWQVESHRPSRRTIRRALRKLEAAKLN